MVILMPGEVRQMNVGHGPSPGQRHIRFRADTAADTGRIQEPGLGPEIGRNGQPRWCRCRFPSRGKSLVEDELNSRTTRGRDG